MASTAIKGHQEITGSLVTVKNLIKESVYILFENRLENGNITFSSSESIKKASMNLKVLTMKVVGSNNKIPKKFEDIV